MLHVASREFSADVCRCMVSAPAMTAKARFLSHAAHCIATSSQCLEQYHDQELQHSHIRNEHRLAIAAHGILEHVCELAGSERDVVCALSQRNHDLWR